MNLQRALFKNIPRNFGTTATSATKYKTAYYFTTTTTRTTTSASIACNRQIINLKRRHEPQTQFYRQFTFTASQLCKFTANLPLNEDRAHDLVFNLKDSERSAIKLALEKYDALRQKETFEGKLAATQWRTRFGRRATVPTLGAVDPTGTFCTFPENWLKLKAAEKAVAPSASDLSRIFIVNAAPFIGFGFLDNFVMIVAGDYIDSTLNTYMCISTMAAAGLGNTLSDVLGIGTAFYIERGCEILGLHPPDLTPGQLELKICRRLANLGRIIGITIGCLLGMVPLLFKKDKAEAGQGEAIAIAN